VYILLRSTIARSAPLATIAWPMTNPSPLAPPVTIPTRPSKEKVGSVRRNGCCLGCSFSLGYSKLIWLSVREALPSWAPADVPVAAVLDLWYLSSSLFRLIVVDTDRAGCRKVFLVGEAGGFDCAAARVAARRI